MVASREVLEELEKLITDPISLEIMKDPVTLETGQTYDRKNIEKHFEEQKARNVPKTCPLTNTRLQNQQPILKTSIVIKSVIDTYQLSIKKNEEAEKKAQLEAERKSKSDQRGDIKEEKKSDVRLGLFNQPSSQEALELANKIKFKEYKISDEKLIELKASFPQFLQHIAYGQLSEADNMLKKNPELLLLKGTVTDYSNRTIEGAALQIAWGADDVSRKEFPDEGMADMLMVHLRKLLGNEAANIEITKQYDEQFPVADEKEEIARNERDLAALNKVFQAVAEAKVEVIDYKTKPDAKCQKALDDFRQYLAPKGVIKTGKHFNVNLLLEAFNLYDKKFDELGGKWDSPRNMLFWQQVIGSIQCLLPACYAQAFCQSLYDVVEGKGQKLDRSLKFRYGGGLFFPLNSDPSFRLGVEIAGGVRTRFGARLAGGRLRSIPLQNLYRAKTEALRELTPQRTRGQQAERRS